MNPIISSLDKMQAEKAFIPDLIHFVWIGMLHHLNADYLKIWQEVNPDKHCQLWQDESCSYCTEFHRIIDEYIYKKIRKGDKELIAIKNDAFNFIYPQIIWGFDFNSLVITFLKSKKIPFNSSSLCDCSPPSSINNIDRKDINSIFTGRFSILKRYYYYEIILRGNLASASDIVRLIVLYQHGGLYIDVDTLPFFENLFHNTNRYLNAQNIKSDQYISLSKTEAVLQVLLSKESHIKDGENYIDEIVFLTEKERSEIKKNICADKKDINIRKIHSLGKIPVYRNLLALGSLSRLKGIYYNNIIASHPSSKAVSIIIRSLNKRYRFIEKHNAIFELCDKDLPTHYLSRLLRWRDESKRQKYNITPILTGPGLIVEVMLGLAYELVEFDSSVSPSQIADYMQNEEFGIAFFRHTLDTPEGLASSWRSRRV